ncbi:MAG TPA: putative ABC exporter domain-containing protein [Geminicoccaceae bacterium]|nr:putative ABC exporter domain-containing protein [Geminicoccaceae bacterium]
MTGTFVYLSVRSFSNRVAARLRRLRQPRYLLGLLVGLAYLYWFVLRHQLRATRRGDLTVDPQFVAVLPAVLVVGGLVLWAVSLVAWVWPSTDPPLRFSRAEVQFFFTAPVSRRQLVHYKLLRSQVGIVFGLLIVSLFSGAAVSGRIWFLLGGWLLFATLRMHLVGVAFTRASLARQGGRPPRSTWIPLGIVGALSAVILGTWAVNLPALVALPFGAAARHVFDAFSSGLPAAALRPFSALVAPVLAADARQFLEAAWPAALLLALNYFWVLRSETTLEEASGAVERDQASGRRPPPRPVPRRAPFRLAPTGRPEVAVLWKNLIFGGRYLTPALAFRLVVPLLLLAAMAALKDTALGFGPVALIAAAALVVLGPYMTRYDLRHDMARLAVLKTWPIRGAALVRGEVLAPALVLTLGVWASLAVALVLSDGIDLGNLPLLDRAWLALAAAVAAPSFLLAQLVIQNAAVVVFPGWVPAGANRPRGIEAMGQQVLMFVGTLLLMALGVLPAAVVAGAAGFILFQAIGYAGLVPASLAFAIALVAESLLAIELLGRLLQRTDPIDVEQAEEG